MDCKDVKMNLSALLDGEVSNSEREELLSHIAACPECRREYEELKELKKEFSKLDVQLKGALADSVMEKIYAKAYPQKKKPFFFRYVGTAAALLIIAGLFVYSKTAPRKEAMMESSTNSSPDVTLMADKHYSQGTTDDCEEESTDGDEYYYTSDGNLQFAVTEPFNKEIEGANGSIKTESSMVEKPKTPMEPMPDEPMVEAPMEPMPDEPMVEAPMKPMPEASMEPETVSPYPDTPFTDDVWDYRYSNSIGYDTSIIFVDTEIETLTAIFDDATEVTSDSVSVADHYEDVTDILLSNSITVTARDISEESTETKVAILKQ